MTYTHVFAVPGDHDIIDATHPETGKGIYSGETLEEIRARYPLAERYEFDVWCEAKAARQDTPIIWDETTEERYWLMLEVLPPALMLSGAFLVGEPMDHHAGTGKPRYEAYRKIGEKYLVASRPLQCSELRKEVAP
jgi:hypothetical protein